MFLSEIKGNEEKVRELMNLMKEIFLFKQEDSSMVGLSSFKRVSKPVKKRVVKKQVKSEVKLSDLMRRA